MAVGNLSSFLTTDYTQKQEVLVRDSQVAIMNPGPALEAVELAKGHEPVLPSEEKRGLDEKELGEFSEEGSVNASQSDAPTEEDLKTLLRVSGKIPWTAYTIAFVELCERFSYYGTTVVCESPNPSETLAKDALS